MSLLTSLLKLFKWNTTDETDLEQEFDIDKAMNDNWDKLDDFAERVNDAVIEIQDDIEEIQNKNTEQDETINTINESISSIQAKDESQDTEIDKQSDLIQKLKDNCINVTTDEATSLHVTDASILPAKLDVRGNQRQEAREGYNVLQNKLTSTTINGVTFTINEDKSVTLNGTATNNIITNLITGKYDDNNATNPLIIPENITNYRLSGCPSGGSWSTYKLDIYAEDNELIATDLGEGANIQKESDTILNLLRVRIIVYAGAVLNNVTFYPMIIYGAENKPYEQYGASPSLDYPSEVRAVGDNVNLFDGEIEEGGYDVNGEKVAAGNTVRNKNFIDIGNYKTVIFSNDGNGIAVNIYEYDKDYTFIKYTNAHASNKTFNKTSTTKYINFSRGNTNVDKIKIEPGEIITSYSPYGQGSVEIKKINSNIMPIQTEKYWEYTENGIKNKANSVGKTITEFTIKKGQTIKIGFIAFTKPSENTTFTCQINDIENSSLNIARFNNFNLNQKYEFSYTAMEDVVFKYVLNGNSANETFEFQLWANLENAEDYQQYEEQSYILDIQKPMLLGDYFDIARGKEVHIWSQKELDGTEEGYLIVMEAFSTDTYKIIQNITIFSNPELSPDIFSLPGNVISNYFKSKSGTAIRDSNVEGINIWDNTYIGLIFGVNCSSVDEFKQILAEKYASGNPVKVYYKLAEPKELDLTEEQKAVLQQLSELPLFKGTNNIITAESLALLQMSYIADTQSYIDSKLNNINQQILELAGGN